MHPVIETLVKRLIAPTHENLRNRSVIEARNGMLRYVTLENTYYSSDVRGPFVLKYTPNTFELYDEGRVKNEQPTTVTFDGRYLTYTTQNGTPFDLWGANRHGANFTSSASSDKYNYRIDDDGDWSRLNSAKMFRTIPVVGSLEPNSRYLYDDEENKFVEDGLSVGTLKIDHSIDVELNTLVESKRRKLLDTVMPLYSMGALDPIFEKCRENNRRYIIRSGYTASEDLWTQIDGLLPVHMSSDFGQLIAIRLVAEAIEETDPTKLVVGLCHYGTAFSLFLGESSYSGASWDRRTLKRDHFRTYINNILFNDPVSLDIGMALSPALNNSYIQSTIEDAYGVRFSDLGTKFVKHTVWRANHGDNPSPTKQPDRKETMDTGYHPDVVLLSAEAV